MDTWPGTLQQKLDADTFEIKVGNTLVRTDMDTGPAKVRSRFTKSVDGWVTSIIIDYTQYDTMINFYKTTLSNGTLPFLFTNPLNLVSEIFRFVEPPDFKPIGGLKYKVNMLWERLPQ